MLARLSCPRHTGASGHSGFMVAALMLGGLSVSSSTAMASSANAGWSPPVSNAYTSFVEEAAQRFGIAPAWIWTVMRVESAGNPRARSRVGAMGLMQLMPATWAGLTARHGLGSDPFDIRANILGGAAYLRAMFDRYGDLASALAAYNAGPTRVDGWRKGTKVLPAETIAYVARIAPALQEADGTAQRSVPRATQDWRSVSLFTLHADRAFGSTAATLDQPATRIPAMSFHRNVAAPTAASPALFIPVSRQGAP